MQKIDLHVHTNCSDGSFSPADAVLEAKRLGLKAIAITDHDSAEGCAEAMRTGDKCGVEVVKGIEITAKLGTAIHILGYYIDETSSEIYSFLKWIQEDREKRNKKMAQLMADDGLDISYERMCEKYEGIIGRPHFAQELVDLGLAYSVNDAFKRYVNKGCRYFIGRTVISVDTAVKMIASAGGVPVLAHPYQYKRNDAELRELIEFAMKNGLRGMECRYSGYSEEQTRYLENIADEYGLLKTGGSDFHGSFKPHIKMGTGISENLSVPYEYLEKLKQAVN